jgi:Secretion system C-terminal sorting domain
VDSTIMVELLVYDDNCNTNICMTEVKVQNKNQPTCAAPTTPSTVSCTDIDKILLNPNGFFTTTASGFYNCGYDIKEIKPEIAVNNCGIGTVTRTWNVVKCDDKTVLKSCKQVIQVTGKSDFSVDFPDDIVVSCQGEIPTKECLKAQMLDPTSWAKGYDGAVKNNACGVMEVSITDEMAMANPNGLGCSIIYRKICVYDGCKYQPNGSGGLTKGLALPGDTHGYATNGWSLPCSVTGAKTVSSDTRRFRDADGLSAENSDGVICYIQTIKIEDVTKPVATILADTAIGFIPKLCYASHSRTIIATDGCTPSTSSSVGLRYKWFVVVKETNKDPNSLTQIASGETNVIAVNDLVAGTYTVLYSVKDLCNNSTPQYSYTLTVRDNEAASIVSIPKKIAVLGGIAGTNGGMSTVCVKDFWMSAKDNCTSERTLRINARLVRETPTNKVAPVYPLDTCVMVTCADVGKNIPVQLWTKDEAGNLNFVIDTIAVQDNNTPKVCTLTGLVATAQGFIVNDKNVAIQNAQISASMRSNTTSLNSVMTSITGGFEINNLILGQGYDFRVAKEDEVYAGVTTLDIAIISRHLLEIEKIKTPCSIIAADVDGNRVVDGADMLHLRNFILRKASSLPAGAWKFVDKKYNFINPNEPLVEDFPQIVTVTNVAQNFSLGFTAVKVGDVNNTYRPQTIVAPTPRSSNTLTFETEDKTLEAGKTYSIKLKSSDFKASDFQFTLGFADGVATMKSVEAGNLPNMGNSNFALFKNAITTSWNGVSKEAEVEAMTLTFVANQNVKLSEVLTINSSITPSEAQNTEGPPMKIQLTFGNNVAKEAGEFALYQNRPNPMLNSTAIGFNLPKEGEATLTIYNIEGKAMKVVNSTFKAGYNEVVVEKEAFQTSGVYYYRLETSEHSATKKMVVSF